MSEVLFIVIVPTAAEEVRLRMQLTGKFDCEAIFKNTVDKESSGLCIAEADLTPVTSNQISNCQYGTFPKRKKTKNRPSRLNIDNELLVDANTTAQTRNIGSATIELKDDYVEKADMQFIRRSWDGLRDMISSSKKKNDKKKSSPLLNIPRDSSMEFVLRTVLNFYQIPNAVWTKDAEGRLYQVLFTIGYNEVYEGVLEKLYEWGIGERQGSMVSVMNCVASKACLMNEYETDNDTNGENINEQKQSVWQRFMNNVRSRLNVTQIVRNVRQDAAITFDFVILLISAAILASFGLVEDSTIFLASSMLISPLMGPIIAAIFGTVIKENSLRALGVKNELFGIFLATLVGFVFGLIACSLDERYSKGEGLTEEILSRCHFHSLLVGIFTAIPSGAAAAISILGGNIGSLVGVAISASLLPPAVNSGLLWALAVIYKLYETDTTRYREVIKSRLYSNNQAAELAVLGSISMCLTISNVVCIYVMGILVLKIKEIAPLISTSNQQFWKHDIKIARHLNTKRFDTDTAIMDELNNMPKEDKQILGINPELLRNIHLDEPSYQNTWSPISCRQPFDSIQEHYSTVHKIERLYCTITKQNLRERTSTCFQPFHFGAVERDRKLPHYAEAPETDAGASINVITPCSTNTPDRLNERKYRKFIVTPAMDPLRLTSDTISDDVDI